MNLLSSEPILKLPKILVTVEMTIVERKLGPLKVIFEDSKITVINESEEPVYVERLLAEYYYTVYMPDGRVVRRRGEETIVEKKELKPNDVIRADLEVRIVGAKAIILEGERLNTYEVVVE